MAFDLTKLPVSGMFDENTGEHASGKPKARYSYIPVTYDGCIFEKGDIVPHPVVAFRACPSDAIPGLCVIETERWVYVTHSVKHME